MADLHFTADWIAGGDGDAEARATFSAIQVVAGGVPLTEVEDTIAKTVRRHIYAPASRVAEWLLARWWRLRWEAPPPNARVILDWRQAHSMAALGGGQAWPEIEIWGDGEFVHVRAHAEPATDVAAIRYLRNDVVQIPAADFESAVDAFVDQVGARLAELLPGSKTTIAELREELNEERVNPAVARECIWQALAGIDPGGAPREWLELARQLVDESGELGGREIFASASGAKGLDRARDALSAMRGSSTIIDLAWTNDARYRPLMSDPPWQRGARAAAMVRDELGVAEGPISDETLGQWLSVRLPLPSVRAPRAIAGGLRDSSVNGRTSVLVRTPRVENQRFYLARLIGCAVGSPAAQRLLPITDAGTALQKLDRAFAQELLCPWSALDPFTDERGVDEEGIEEAADYFRISERVVLTTLVNHGKISRDRLAA